MDCIFFLDHFLDHFLDNYLEKFTRGEAHHWHSGRGRMNSISTEGGVGGRVLLLREG